MGKKIPYQYGKNGITHHKVEGDMMTPLVTLRPVFIYYRAGHVSRPKSKLPVLPIYKNNGWCDADGDRQYNHPVALPFRRSAEALWRKDHAYDYIIVTDYNYPDARKNKGSAIFIHVTHDDKRPTAGCIALSKNTLKRLFLYMDHTSQFIISA